MVLFTRRNAMFFLITQVTQNSVHYIWMLDIDIYLYN
jgi:hypothetical protein